MRITLALVVTVLILQVSHTQSFVPTTKTCIFKFQQRSSECFISGDASSSYNLDFFDATSSSSSSSNNNSDSNNSNNRFHERKVKDEVDDDMDEYELEQYQKQVLLSQYSSTTNNSNGNSNNIPIPKNAQLVPSSSSTTSTGSSAISSDGNTVAASAYYPSVTFDLTLPSMQMLEGVILRQGLLYQKNKNSNGVKRMELMSMNTVVNPAASLDAEEEEDVPCWSVLYDNDNNNNNNNMDNMILFEYLPSSVQNQTGLRRNDILLGTSATMGTQIWPKSTLEGIAAALQSRMLLRTDMTLRILRYADSSTITSVSTTSSAASTTSNAVENVAAEVYETYDVTLTKPLGIYVQQQLLDNTLVITNSTIHTNKIRTGDVIIAIDNGMTMNMNAVQNIEGLISSVTSRLPNQPVTLRIRRKVPFVDVGEDLTTTASIPGSDIASSSDVSKSVVVAEDGSSTPTSSKSSVLAGAILSNAQERILLHKCRAYLNKYLARTTTTTANTASSNTTTQLQSLYQAVSKVRDTLNTVHRSTSVTFDARTLALVLQSYITCEAYDEALTVFEYATGLSAYGTDALRSTDNSSTDDNRWYLNQSTKSVDNAVCTLLLQVHAALGDFKSAARVSLAMSGKSGQFSVFVDTLPGTYNINTTIMNNDEKILTCSLLR